MKLVYSEIFDSAWKSIKDDLALSAGLTLVFLVAAGVCSKIPFVGTIVSLPLGAGYIRCLLKIRAKETMGYGDFFWGFSNLNRLLHLILLNLLIGIGGAIGLVLLVIPGVWWFVATGFGLQIFVLKDVDAVEALKSSLALVKGRWWNVFGLTLTGGLLVMAGFICLFVGALIAIPVATLAMVFAAEKLMADPQILNPSTPPEPTTPVETTIVLQ